MKNLAPSYIAAIVAILFNLQGLLGLDLTSADLTATVSVLAAVVVAIRQLVNGRSTLGGMRP